MILDINAFIGKWPYWPSRVTTAEETAAEFTAWGIAEAAICSTRGVFVNWQDGNAETAAAARAHAGRFHAFACLGTRELSHKLPDGPFDFDALEAQGFRGIRLYPQHHSYNPLDEPFIGEIAEQARARRWPVMLPLRIIMNWGVPMMDLSVMRTLIERHPRTTWILAGINYLSELQMAVALMRAHPTVHLETSCVMGYEAVAKTVQQCGADRLLFGTAAPLQHGRAGLEKILHAKLTSREREAILGGNACRLLRLDE
jgi:uncharacterized protein